MPGEVKGPERAPRQMREPVAGSERKRRRAPPRRAPVYVFKHALIQEVAYASLPESGRRALHAAAGRALETLYGGRLEEAYDSLAYHYSKTDDSAKAVEYLTRSAERAARSYAHEEAVHGLQEAVAHVGRLPEAERDARLFDLLLRQGFSLTALGRVQEVLDLFLPHQERIDRLGDRALAGRYYFLVGRTYSFLGQQTLGRIAQARGAYAEAEAHLTAARETFAAIRSRYELGRTYLDLASLARLQGNREALVTNLRAAHDLFRTLRVEKYVRLAAHLARQFGVVLSGEPPA